MSAVNSRTINMPSNTSIKGMARSTKCSIDSSQAGRFFLNLFFIWCLSAACYINFVTTFLKEQIASHFMDVYEQSIDAHKKKGKVAIKSKLPLNNKEDLSIAYTPGVAAVCKKIAAEPSAVFTHTIKGNSVAIVSDGSAILGLGNLGAEAAIPVMEGKAVLFKKFANID